MQECKQEVAEIVSLSRNGGKYIRCIQLSSKQDKDDNCSNIRGIKFKMKEIESLSLFETDIVAVYKMTSK